MKNQKILLVDYYNVALRGMHVHQYMHYHGKQTGGLYGFCNIIFSNITKHKPTEILFIKDGIKTQINPNASALELAYKANRKQTIDKTYFTASLSLINEFIAISGIGGVLQKNNIEADDIIASICEQESSPIIILSNDSDLFSNLRFDNVTVQTHKTPMTKEEYIKIYGISPIYHNIYLALCGGHNNLPHPKGIGPKKALAVIKKGISSGDILKTISGTLSKSDYGVFDKVYKRITNEAVKEDIRILLSNKILITFNRIEAEDYLISNGVRLANTRNAFDILSNPIG